MQPYRPTSSLKTGADMMARPMSSVKSAGYSKQNKEKSAFDGLPEEDNVSSPEKQAEQIEISIYQNIRDAMILCDQNQFSQAVAKLQESLSFLGQLKKIHIATQQQEIMQPSNMKLDCCIRRHVCKVFILAKQYDQALVQCERMLKQCEKQEMAEVRMTMGNIYFYKSDYEKAHRVYSMALDVAPPEYARLRQMIAQQIAITQVKLDRWNQAVDAIEENLIKSISLVNSKNEETDKINIYALMTKFKPIYTLIICYYAINDQRQMMEAFKRLIETCQLIGDNPDMFDDNDEDDNAYMGDNVMNNGGDDELDDLSRYNASVRHEQRSKLLSASRLLAPVICNKEIDGYERLADLLKEKGHQTLSLQVLMSKALYLLENNNFEQATTTMMDIDRIGLESALSMGINVPQQVLERSRNISLTIAAAAEQQKPQEEAAEALGIDKNLIKTNNKSQNYMDMEKERQLSAKKVVATDFVEKKNKIPYATFVPRGVHTNIAFIHYLKGDFEASFAHSTTAILVDPFDSFAKVNLGCTLAKLDRWDASLKEFDEAYEMNPDCLQAVYNSGLVYFKKQEYESALIQFTKVITRIPQQTDALFMSAECLIKLTKIEEAVVMLNSLQTYYLNYNTQDPCVFSRLGELHQILGEESQGAHYFKEAHRLVPYNLDIIKWLGSYYVRQELYEQARLCFEKGAQVDYLTPTWFLSAAACLRKTNQTREATEEYRKILKKWPACIDAIKYLIVCLQTLGQNDEANQWQGRLEKVQAGGLGQSNDNTLSNTKLETAQAARIADNKLKVVEDQPDMGNNEDLFGNDDVAGNLLNDQE
ncbi:Intraflagellar transport protein 88 [Spironucleus salmonicida]|uniref:Intraflagellar transport protein 88 n=1 Tax=Spironucleus salmonicida TaxID=348837 RepID=V6LRK5_9EUKA|nr:Intraflagellar transport protein 88 [Spironucleus salmonicida]|eukprot:EST46898.1 Intraflagellar transport protein 88 [Spironucleus salmonicida]